MNYFLCVVIAFVFITLFYEIFRFRKCIQFLKSKGSFKVENQKDYFAKRMAAWPYVQGNAIKVEICERVVFVDNGEMFKCFLKIVTDYRVGEKFFKCTLSPYEFNEARTGEIAESLKRQVIEDNLCCVYYDPENPSKSFYVYKGLLSWSDFENHIKASTE